MISRGTLAAQIAVVLAVSSAPVAAQTPNEGMSSLDSLSAYPSRPPPSTSRRSVPRRRQPS